MDKTSTRTPLATDIFNWFRLRCPACDGVMELVGETDNVNMFARKDIYKCKKCGKEWV